MWVTEMEGDVESDLSVFHRVDDMESMGSRRWARLVPRLSAYAGAVQYRFQEMDRKVQQAESQSPAQPAAPQVGGSGVLAGPSSPMKGGQEVNADRASLTFSDIGDMFSFSEI